MRKIRDARRKIRARGKKKGREMRTPCWQEAAGPGFEDAVCLEITNSRLFIFSVFRSDVSCETVG